MVTEINPPHLEPASLEDWCQERHDIFCWLRQRRRRWPEQQRKRFADFVRTQLERLEKLDNGNDVIMPELVDFFGL